MLQEYDWIQAERQFFGQPNSIYDFKVSLWMAVISSRFFKFIFFMVLL
jgi:hypothetical protein